MSKIYRYMGVKVLGQTADYVKPHCPDCGLLFFHKPDCGLDMSVSAMNPGSPERAALADAQSGVTP